MKLAEQKRALQHAMAAARGVGKLLRANQFSAKKTRDVSEHDIKLELDEEAQDLIQQTLHKHYPGIAMLGEEGISGDPGAQERWVVDPIDGTVNYSYGIPHAAVSIALQERSENPAKADYSDGYNTLLGVVYDPFCGEMWTAVRGESARMNGAPVHVSNRRKLADAVISLGFAKTKKNLEAALPYFTNLVHRARKIRIMGSAALSLTYVASGRFDAYVERGIRLWDVAAGGLIIQCAKGHFWVEPIEGDYAYRMVASNAHLHKLVEKPS